MLFLGLAFGEENSKGKEVHYGESVNKEGNEIENGGKFGY